MSSLSSLDGVKRVFKELSTSLEAANDELIETRRRSSTYAAKLTDLEQRCCKLIDLWRDYQYNDGCSALDKLHQAMSELERAAGYEEYCEARND